MHASGCAGWPHEGNNHLWLISIPKKGWSLPSGVWVWCAKVFSTCALISLFSSCFPVSTFFGCYLTVKTTVTFISMNSYHKLPASCRKHWIIMPTHLVHKVSHWDCWLWKIGEMNCVLHHSPFVPNWLAGSASLRCTPGGHSSLTYWDFLWFKFSALFLVSTGCLVT